MNNDDVLEAIRRGDVSALETLLQRLNEHNCLVLVDQNPIFEMPADGAPEHDLLQVAAFAQHVLDRVAMGNAH